MFKLSDLPSIEEVSRTDENPHVIHLNGQRYLFVAVLENGVESIVIPNKYMMHFALNDALTGFEQSGFLRYRDPYFSIRDGTSLISNVLGQDCFSDKELEKDGVKNISFTGGGKERVHIKMAPIRDGEETEEDELVTNTGDWLLQQTFVVTNIENELSQLASKVFKVEFLGVETYAIETQRRPDTTMREFKSSLDVQGTSLSSSPTLFASKYPPYEITGEVMYRHIQNAYQSYQDVTGFDMSGYLPKVELTSSGELTVADEEKKGKLRVFKNVKKDKNTYKVEPRTRDYADHDVWDRGLGLVMDTVGQKEHSTDIIQRCMMLHVSEEKDDACELSNPSAKAGCLYDPCLLKLRRTKDEKRPSMVTLRPFVSFFKNFGDFSDDVNYEYGPEYMDTFLLQDTDNTTDSITGVVKGFLKFINPCDTETKGKISDDVISEFEWVPTRPSDAETFFRHHIVKHVGPNADIMIMNQTDGDLENVVEYISKKYLPYFKTVGDDPEKTVNIDENTDMSALIFDSRVNANVALVAMGRNKLIQAITLMNDHISFRTVGSTHRQSGQSFTVDKWGGSDVNSDVLNRVLGVWWATDITHDIDFSDKTYYNEITGTKFYRFKESQIQSSTRKGTLSGVSTPPTTPPLSSTPSTPPLFGPFGPLGPLSPLSPTSPFSPRPRVSPIPPPPSTSI